MVESQSRFSIIDELTQKMNNFRKDIVSLKTNMENKKANQKIREEDVARQLAREKESLAREEINTGLSIQEKEEAINDLKSAIDKISDMSTGKESK